MAHFARLDSNNKVTRVHVVDNNWVLDGEGNESESVGVQYLQNLYNTTDTFVQCSVNGTIRSLFPRKGDTYNSTDNRFEKPRPENSESWVRNSTTGEWEPPVPMPPVTDANEVWRWNEETISWDDVRIVEVPEETPE